MNFAILTLATDAPDEQSSVNLKERPMKSPFPEHSSTPPNELAVIGENKDDPSRLLLLGADGHYYAYSLPDGEPEEVDPDDDWKIESQESEELFT